MKTKLAEIKNERDRGYLAAKKKFSLKGKILKKPMRLLKVISIIQSSPVVGNKPVLKQALMIHFPPKTSIPKKNT